LSPVSDFSGVSCDVEANTRTVVFWGVIFSGFSDEFDVWSNASEHALNSVFAFFEIVVPRTEKTPKLHTIPVVIILALYLGLAYVTVATDHFYVYAFLDPYYHSQGVIAGYIIGILIGTLIMFFIVHFLIKFRRWLTEDKMGMTGKLTGNNTGYVRDIETGDMSKGVEMMDQSEFVR
jgi:hypothetical protein